MNRIIRVVIISLACAGYFPGAARAQSPSDTLHGRVTEWDDARHAEMPLPGANIHLSGTVFATMTGADGKFELVVPAGSAPTLVTSYVGYVTDTTFAASGSFHIRLRRSVELSEVVIARKQESLGLSTLQPMNTEKISEKELLKAACCNLSESFETNPTVNVAYTDAVTGAREIQMLGLSGIYSQLLSENIPTMRGIAGAYGLTFIPGPWMESIQVTKGSGSVVNGFESTTGQLNVEFRKPEEKETPRFYLNLFGESNSNAEINALMKKALNSRWSTALFLHGNFMNRQMDENGDGFMDLPRNSQMNLYNRWKYHSGKKLEAQFGIKALSDRRRRGQVHAQPDDLVDRRQVYLAEIDNQRIELEGKIGIVYPEKPLKSIGNIISWQLHDLDAAIGLKDYQATQQTFYYQGIYQDIIGSAAHGYKTGVSLLVDRMNETYRSDTLPGPDTDITRFFPGVFGEYTYSYFDTWKIVAGLRADHMQKTGVVLTPRLHAKVNFNDRTILRFSGGRSIREPYPIADNISVLSSAKQLDFAEAIRAEEAWNYGANLTRSFRWKDRDGTFNIDLYRTHFVHQLVVDRYSDSLTIRFYNLEGESFANSFQVSLSFELLHGLDARVAYKLDDVRSTFSGVLERKPLVPRDRFLFHLSAAPEGSRWKADATVNWTGTQRLANTTTDPEFGKLPDESPSFTLINFQLTREFRHFELYAGAENLTDFRQDNPIIAAADPFSPSFDASNIWGPVDGRRIYAGLRYKIR